MYKKIIWIAALVLPLFLSTASRAEAATRTWDGSIDTNWATAANWVEEVVPVSGDELVFPEAAANKATNNDLPAANQYLQVEIVGTDYSIGGNTLQIASGGSLEIAEVALITSVIEFPPDAVIVLDADLEISVSDGASSNIEGNISGPGELIKSGLGELVLAGSSNFTGGFDITAGAVWANSVNALGTDGNQINVAGGATLYLDSPGVFTQHFTLNGGEGWQDFAGSMRLMQSLTLQGAINLATSTTSHITTLGSSTVMFTGGFFGTGSVIVDANSKIVLTAVNESTGNLTMIAGQLVVDGEVSEATIVADGSGVVIGGSGQVAGIDTTPDSSSTVSPGDGTTATMTVNGNLSSSSQTTYNFQLNGLVAGDQYDQLLVAGAIDLGGASLNVTNGFTPNPGAQFTLVDNVGMGAINGIFNGLPEGAELVIGSRIYIISYVGGTGNDVVLTVSSTPPPPPASPVYRFLHKQLKIHFYTASESERNFVAQNLGAIWELEGTAYMAYTTNVTNTTAVHRFLHKDLKIHFYTASSAERNFVQQNLGSIWEYEGVSFYAFPSAGSGREAVYRFLHKDLKIHFYTANSGERNFVQSNLSSVWEYEGVSYYSKQ